MQYALTRGRQRAEFESATEGLAKDPLRELSVASQMVSQRVAPSVVHIETLSRSTKTIPQDEMAHLFGVPRRERKNRGQGSGVVVSKDGYILTNLHVISDFEQIVVKLSDGRRLPAVPVGADRLTDLALLRINADNLIAAEWGDSESIEEGALVWAVGSPFGFQHSITSGIVSAKNRGNQAGTVYQDFLQTDAAVNPGNSGGPLVDSRGRIVGINTMIVGPAFQGISLAIPSNVAQRIFDRLRTDGRVARGWLGIQLNEITPDVASNLDLPDTNGAMIKSLVRNGNEPSPAELAGLRPLDVIVDWNGTRIDKTSDLSLSIAQTPIGHEVEVAVIRGGERATTKVMVGERPLRFN
jgi:S1-C subfamily serine protease